MSIRRAKLSDALAIATVHVRSWQSAYRGLLPQDYLDGLDPGNGRPARSASWASWTGRAGACWSPRTPARSSGSPGFAPAATPTWIRGPSARSPRSTCCPRPGAAATAALMGAALDTLGHAACGQAALWVLDTNQRARRFYEAAGWRTDGAAKQEPWPGAGFTISEVRYRHPLPRA